MTRLIPVALIVFASMVGMVGVSSVAAQSTQAIMQQLQLIKQSLNSLQTDVNSLQNAVKQIPPTWSQKLPVGERFELVLDGAAVLDKETGLVWDRAPVKDDYNWYAAFYYCYQRNLGGRKGWHLPTVEQLTSLVDPSALSSPVLPTGHPFILDCSDPGSQCHCWSASAISETAAFDVNFGEGGVYFNGKENTITGGMYAWCVRGGEAYDER